MQILNLVLGTSDAIAKKYCLKSKISFKYLSGAAGFHFLLVSSIVPVPTNHHVVPMMVGAGQSTFSPSIGGIQRNIFTFSVIEEWNPNED